MQIQRVLNSDIVMQFDECTPYETKGHITTGEARLDGAEPALGGAAGEFERLENPNALFGIVQGGMFEHLREESLPRWSSWTCPATPSAASASASPRKTCSASWRTRRTACPRTSRAT
jgi:tRNA-guanine family transglycosylase